MAHIDKIYHNVLKKILNEGFKYEDPNRKGVNRIQIPSYQIQHDFKDGFPAITTKKLYWKGVVGELLWFLRGDTNIKYLIDNGINIWNKDAYNHESKKTIFAGGKDHWLKEVKKNNYGDLGRVYGAQWRKWSNWKASTWKFNNEYIDQISNLIRGLKENPMGTRHIVTAWNPAELDDMALPPCHWSFEILVKPIKQHERVNYYLPIEQNIFHKKYLKKIEEGLIDLNVPKYQFTLKWHQRSCDSFLGMPFNIASYALLAHIIGKMTNMIPKGIIGDLSNVHIYEPHLDAVKEQLSRDFNKYDNCELEFLNNTFELYKLNHDGDIDWLFKNSLIEDFKLQNYKSYPRIPAEMLAYNK